jgi:hypothetical protein
MIDRIINHNFLNSLAEYARPVIDLHDENLSNIREGFAPKRNLRVDEEYLRTTLLCGGELATTCSQLDQTIQFLSNFRSTKKLKEYKINRYDHVVYHLENHLIRITSIFDRCLIFTNQVFLLGNTPKNCKQYIILKNQYVQGTIIAKILKKIEKHINPYRTKRNVIVHQEGYSHKDLRILEGYSILEKQGEDFFHQYYYKRQIDGFVKERKAELEVFNNTLFRLIDDFLTELLKIFENKYKKLKPV